jgi:hypothetical protein
VNEQWRRMLTGISIKQEYLCLALEDFTDGFSVHLTTRHDDQASDVTASHVFLGYSPLVLAVPFADAQAESMAAHADEICLTFTRQAFSSDHRWRNFPSSRAGIARLHLKQIATRRIGQQRVNFYEGVHGWHRLLGPFHRTANRWWQTLKKKPAGNVTLSPNLYEQVRIAYSLPRIISLVSVGDAAGMNLFPTDLHGPVGEEHYLSSLRVGGCAREQVRQFRRIVISEVSATEFKSVYRLGKNHMLPLADRGNFELAESPSATLSLPLPRGVVRYRELEWYDTFDAGIHSVFCYRVLNCERRAEQPRLAHVHHCYAQWRSDAGLATQYLQR